MLLVIVQLRLLKLLGPELTAACLARVRLHVIGVIPRRSAGLARQSGIPVRVVVALSRANFDQLFSPYAVLHLPHRSFV